MKALADPVGSEVVSLFYSPPTKGEEAREG